MSLATTYSRATLGIDAPLISVEAHLGNGLPAFNIVGLPEKAVQESRDRVRSALVNSGFDFPARRITVNLAPADLPKEGSRFDLPIALGILAASGQLPKECLAQAEFVGELTLAGQIRPIRGLLPVALAAGRSGRTLFLPRPNGAEAALVPAAQCRVAEHLLEICAHLQGQNQLPSPEPATPPEPDPAALDFQQVRGQDNAKRALLIAAAGGHNLLLSGPPGSGKSMLAQRLPGIMPQLSEAEAMECAAIRSVSGIGFEPSRYREVPYRHPHHSASEAALVGGGSNPRPGEISLAHLGILFLDELPEFNRRVLEALREPLENGRIALSRAARQAEYPARFQLIAAMNPCPCGHLGDPSHSCRCTSEQVARYQGRLSGPLLDRLDLFVAVQPVAVGELTHPGQPGTTSAELRAAVTAARAAQWQRQGGLNRELIGDRLSEACALDAGSQRRLQEAMQRLGLSARAYHKTLRVARTIADLAGQENIAREHLLESLAYRKRV